MRQFLLTLLPLLLSITLNSQSLKMPSIFGDHMVLQREHVNPVWGWADPGETITVEIDGQAHQLEADETGYWKVFLQPIPVGGPYEMQIASEHSQFTIKDILVGEVWICSGQSNMAWPVAVANHAELEIQSANYPEIRLISVPQVGTQEIQNDFKGAWSHCTPTTVKNFSAIGYFFGRRLHKTLDVPIGLIDNAWGGSAAEAWIPREVLNSDPRYKDLMDWWREQEASYDFDKLMEEWEVEMQAWKDGGQQGNAPRSPRNLMTGNHRPANIYNGVLNPTIGYGMKGVIWYQGESNAGRAYQYRDLFPLMIETWREKWGQGNFPFYYVQLADFLEENEEPGESNWAELREAQTMTMDKLSNVGEAVIIDVGEGRDIHPRDKQTVANRLVRWALARDYQVDMDHRSPRFQSMEIEGNKVTLTFNHVGSTLYTFDVDEARGFTIAGDDKHFVKAQAKIVDENKIEVWSDQISSPVAVRYAWANNPKCNVYTREGLPLTPFRTDTWDGATKGVEHN